MGRNTTELCAVRMSDYWHWLAVRCRCHDWKRICNTIREAVASRLTTAELVACLGIILLACVFAIYLLVLLFWWLNTSS